MKEKTFLHLHRNDVSMTLGGASIEHPLSIHSASIGTSRKPAGNTAIIRCMAAMFVMLFTIGIGNMWSATKPGAKMYVTPNPASSGGYVYTNKSQPNSASSYGNATKNTTVRGTTESVTNNVDVWVGALALHGYKFVKWSSLFVPSGAHLNSADSVRNLGYSEGGSSPALLNLYQYKYNVTTPNVNNTVYEYKDTAFFATASKANVKIQKESRRGTIDTKVVYYKYTTKVVTEPIICPSMALNSSDTTYSKLSETDDIYEGDCVVLTAHAAERYDFYGWYKVEADGTKTLISTDATLVAVVEGNMTFYAYFAVQESYLNLTEDDKFLVGTSACQTFEQALAAATNGSLILQLQDYTIPAGNYVLPAGITLLIPKNADQKAPRANMERISTSETASTAYRTLTLANGAHLDVYGTIEVGGTQSAGVIGAGGEDGIGFPTGTYGCLQMNAGSSMTLNNGALLYAWGYVLGDRDESGKYQCEIDARRGSRVYEHFQLMDWKGGTYTMGMFDGINSSPTGYQVLPVNQYYIQNVEVPVKYRPGAKLFAAGSVYLDFYGTQLMFNIDNAGIIGAKYTYTQDASIFLMNDEDDSEDTWVRKYYDINNDKQVYEANNSAYLGSLVMSINGQLDVDSREYKLPITNNFKIHLLYGNMEVTQKTELLAGAEIEVDKESTLTIPEDVTLYLWDKNDWNRYVSTTRNPNSTFTFGSATTVKWRPGGRPTVRRDADTVVISDAKLTMHGSANIEGYLKTSAHGTSITSTIEDAGTVIFANNTPADADAGKVWQVRSLPASAEHSEGFIGINCTSAKLTNEDGTFTSTASTVATRTNPISFCFIDFDGDGNGEWKSLETEGCFVKDENNVYYIKPQEYVAISQGAAPQEEADHTYRDHYAGTGKIFIEMDCQWWEVTATTTPGIYHCEHPDNNTYYYYSEADGTWLEKKFKVSWVNWDGSPVNYTNKDDEEVNYYMVTYGTVPTWLSANPTHADDASHTYSFNGWMPTPAAVTADVTYVAQYEERDRMYAITFNDESDELIQLLYCKLGEIPVCTKYDAAANNKVWMTPGENPQALGAVAGNVTYKLYAKETKSSYTIRFVNWNGTELQSGSVTAGQMPTPPANPTKDSDDLHSYSFNAWNPALAAADADATYTATYTAGPRGYTVLWKNGETTIETDENVLYGTVPEYNGATPAKSGFTFVGWSPAVSAVTGEATYTAQFLENRTISNEQTISANTEVSTITVETSGELTVNNNITLTAENLILKSTSGASGQIIPAGNKSKFNVTNAYYDLNLNIDGRHWFAFGVPWVVNLDVTPLTEVESGRTLVLGRDYEIVYYNGATRATQGAGAHCWEKVADGTHILQPGKGYMIAFAGHINTVRFAKATGTPVIFNGTVKLQNEYGDGDNNGWNGLANPMAFHAKFTDDDAPTVGYVHNGEEIGHDGYTECNLENKRMIVGKMVYVQVASTDTVTPVQATTGEFVAAPARRTKATDKRYLSLRDYYQIGIADANEQGGSVYVLPEEDKADKYVIGHDLSHLGISDQKAQIWVFRYGTKLALNTTAPIDDVAEYALRVYAPKNGEYTITNNQSPVSDDEYVVYLTCNGEAIWNLSDGAYTTDLTSGVHKEYGLRLSARKTPAVVTGIDEAIVDANGETRKVLINNQVFIIRGNEVYTIDGQMVK